MKHILRKSILLISCFLAVALVTIGTLFFWIPSHRIASYERGYRVLVKGMSKQQVFEAMGKPTRVGGPATEFWDEVKLEGAETNRITQTLNYRVSTLFLPVTYRLSFDTNGQLVGKHRY